MAKCGCYTDVVEKIPFGAVGYSTSPDPPSRRTNTNMLAANPYMPPNGFADSAQTGAAHCVDDITSQAPPASMPDAVLVAGAASLLALRNHHAQVSVRPLNDKQADRDHVELEWMSRYHASSNELIASELYVDSDEQLDEEEDADFDLLSLLCSASESIVPDSVTLPTHVSADDTAKSHNMSQPRQPRVSQLLMHSVAVPACSANTSHIMPAPKSVRPSASSNDLIVSELCANSDEQLDEENDADFDLLSLLCSASEPIVPSSVTLPTHVSVDDTAKSHTMYQHRHSRVSQLLTHSVAVPTCSAKAPQIPTAPKCGRPNGRIRPHVS